MKKIIYQLIIVCILLLSKNSLAQESYTVSGTVQNEKGEPLAGAIAFINGSQKITTTDDLGRFIFANMQPGTFKLSIHILGYSPSTEDLVIRNISLIKDFTLKEKIFSINEVVITPYSDWKKYYNLFKEKFLGTSTNAKSCVILNPKAISFTLKRGVLTAKANEFIIIENQRLGYRVKYLLKYFSYNSATGNTGYDGDTNFEKLSGSAQTTREWIENRLEAYQGSFMHFLRSVYWNTTLKEGFLAYHLFADSIKLDRFNDEYVKVSIDTRPIKFDSLVTVLDTSFISLKFTHLYIIYNPKNAAVAAVKDITAGKKSFELTNKGSTIKLYLKEAIIDQKGSYADYRTFLIRGNWSRKRVGDQLPFEYHPNDIF
jgi:hypothetical protein